MVHGTIAAVEWKTRESWVGSGRAVSGRVGSGRVGSGRVGTKYLPFIRHPNSCIVVYQQVICLLVLLDVLASRRVVSLSTRIQSGVHHSLGITFSVFVDNGGHKRRQTSRPDVRAKVQTNCNFKHTYFMVATFWVLIVVAGLCYILDYRIDMWCDHIIIPSCLIISVASYTKIFCILRHHHEAHVQGLFNNSRSNQMYLTWRDTKRQCIVSYGCS